MPVCRFNKKVYKAFQGISLVDFEMFALHLQAQTLPIQWGKVGCADLIHLIISRPNEAEVWGSLIQRCKGGGKSCRFLSRKAKTSVGEHSSNRLCVKLSVKILPLDDLLLSHLATT